MSDRDCRALRVCHGVHASAELSGERLDDDRAQSGRCPRRARLSPRCANAVVGNRKPLASIGRVIGNDKPASGAGAGKGVLERIDDELGDNEPEGARIGR